MRKTKACTATAVHTLAGRLLARTCLLGRNHAGKHHDAHGAWAL